MPEIEAKKILYLKIITKTIQLVKKKHTYIQNDHDKQQNEPKNKQSQKELKFQCLYKQFIIKIILSSMKQYP